MNLITEKEYRNHIKFHEELIELIISKTTQLSLMLYNKPPKGIFTSLDDLDEKDGKICVQFESYLHGESNYDTFHLPIEFLFDESYPEKYKLIWEEEKRKEKEEKERKKKEEKENIEKKIEDFERKIYERLKLKYEFQNVKCESYSSNIFDINVDKIWDKDDHTL